MALNFANLIEEGRLLRGRSVCSEAGSAGACKVYTADKTGSYVQQFEMRIRLKAV